ncbi:purine and uridine phosphorylase [Aureobasidium pullulans]|uniref:Purine and uridine phosphorylase n=1 Tax=Aureobasidium pullulans TaxID=5580 RepID=A0A4S8Z6F5_AURPU|nr:purine and uridine phosphorylase [Aureobasidium pullulans]
MTSDLSKYTIGWIAALHIELAAATVMLDEEHPKLPYDERDPNQYTLGHIGEHNVVIACLPAGQTGTSAATAVATQMLNKFKSIRIGFLVGIGGGVPSPKADIRLGDVVVSLPDMGHGGVVQYDLGKAEAKGHFRRTGHLNTPPKLLLSVVTKARARYEVGESKHVQYLAKFSETTILKKRFSRNSTGQDKLFQPTYDHAGGTTCENCKSEMLLDRPLREVDGPSGADSTVEVHFGTIASGNMVMKDANMRDNISEQLGGHILCFEMEAAGLMNDFPCLVVRGICDYADSHKQDQWQRYAAATAAAYTKELLMWTPPAAVSILDSIKPSEPVSAAEVSHRVPFYIRFKRHLNFVGREKILHDLHRLMELQGGEAAIWGLGGCGKSAIATEFAYQIHDREPSCAVFWVPAIDPYHFRQAFREIAIFYELPGADNLEKDIVEAVKAKLMEGTALRWLLVIDNADDTDSLSFMRNGVQCSLLEDVPSKKGCMTLFTTRSKKNAIRLVRRPSSIIAVESFELLDARKLYQSLTYSESTTRDSHVDALLQELAFLPLAIVQAVMFMRENSLHESRYLELFRYQKLQDQSTDLLAQEFHDRNRYFGHANAVTTTWHLSFKQLQFHNPLAARLLSFLACIAPLDVPDSIMLPGISDPLLRLLAIEMLIGYQFLIRHRDDSLYDVQSLVHTTARRWLVNAGTWTTCTESAIQMLTPLIPHGGYDDHINYQLRVGHGLHLLSHYSTQHERTIELWSRIGDCQRDLGYYSSAELCHRVVLDWRQIHLGPWHPKTLQKRQDVGQDLMLLGQYSRAEALHRETFALRCLNIGLSTAGALSSMRNIAEALGFQGKWKEFEMIVVELEKLSRAWLGPTHPITISSLKALSVCSCRLGRYEEAEQLASQVVLERTRAERLGAKSPSTLRSTSHLALIQGLRGRWRQAEVSEANVAREFESTLGLDHPDTSTSRYNLAKIKMHLGDFDGAKYLLEQVLDSRTKVLGSRHPDTLTAETELTRLLSRQTSALEHVLPSARLLWNEHKKEGDFLGCILKSVHEQATNALQNSASNDGSPHRRKRRRLASPRPSKPELVTVAVLGERFPDKPFWIGSGLSIREDSNVIGGRIYHCFKFEILDNIDNAEPWTWLRSNVPLALCGRVVHELCSSTSHPDKEFLYFWVNTASLEPTLLFRDHVISPAYFDSHLFWESSKSLNFDLTPGISFLHSPGSSAYTKDLEVSALEIPNLFSPTLVSDPVSFPQGFNLSVPTNNSSSHAPLSIYRGAMQSSGSWSSVVDQSSASWDLTGPE